MNLVAVLIAPAVVAVSPLSQTPSGWRFVIALGALAIIVVAVAVSSRRGIAMADTPAGPGAGGTAAVGPADADSGNVADDVTVPGAFPHTDHPA
jgi:K(+)-stimulated pyrophosphate-energized sodium pump